MDETKAIPEQIVKEKLMNQKCDDGEITRREYAEYCLLRKNTKAKSLSAKYKDGEIPASEYLDYLAQRRGFSNHNEYIKYRVKKQGYKNISDYNNEMAKKLGFADHNDYNRHRTYDCGKASPFFENKNCTLYFGVHIAERYLAKIFENVTRMPINNKGYDFICNKGYKIDVKSRCISKNNKWVYAINRNKIADYFLLLAFDDRHSLNPNRIWLIKGTEIIETKRKSEKKDLLNNKNSLTICNIPSVIEYFKKYELTDKLEKLKECCDTLKNKDD